MNHRRAITIRSSGDAVEQADGTWLVNDVRLAEPGTWTVRVYVWPDHGDPIPLDAPIVIER